MTCDELPPCVINGTDRERFWKRRTEGDWRRERANGGSGVRQELSFGGFAPFGLVGVISWFGWCERRKIFETCDRRRCFFESKSQLD